MVEAVLRARGLYSLKLTARTGVWNAQLSGDRWVEVLTIAELLNLECKGCFYKSQALGIASSCRKSERAR